MFVKFVRKDLINRSILYTPSNSMFRLKSSRSLCLKLFYISNRTKFSVNSTNYLSLLITRNLSTSINSLNLSEKDKIVDLDISNSLTNRQVITSNFSDTPNKIINIGNVNSNEVAGNLLDSEYLLNDLITASDIGLSPILLPRVFFDLITTLHNYTKFSWVTSIAVSCLALRLLTFPLYISSKRSSIEIGEKMLKVQSNIANIDFNNPSSQDLKQKQTEALKSMNEYRNFLPKALISPITQAIVFSSFYFCLRKMAKYPIESMKSESFLWVPSLTECDPYCLFPLLTSSTFFLMLKFSMEVDLPGENKALKYFTYLLPLLTFAFASQMPANLTIYWFINNNFTVCLFYFLKIPKVKGFFKLREMKKDPNLMKKLANQSFDNSMNKMKILFDLKEQEELNQRMKKSNQMNHENLINEKQIDADQLFKKIEELKKMIDNMKKSK